MSIMLLCKVYSQKGEYLLQKTYTMKRLTPYNAPAIHDGKTLLYPCGGRYVHRSNHAEPESD